MHILSLYTCTLFLPGTVLYSILYCRFQRTLSTMKSEIEKLNNEIEASKTGYSSALRKLESLSEEIHERRNAIMKLAEREPGVGAEDNGFCEAPRDVQS